MLAVDIRRSSESIPFSFRLEVKMKAMDEKHQKKNRVLNSFLLIP